MKVVRFESADSYEPEKDWKRLSLCSQEDISIEYFVKPPNHASPRHEHPNAQVLIVLKGKLTIATEDGEQEIRCTSCGICAKVCPPQCIWIERTTNPETKRPVPEPKEFYIDVDICMNCGFCSEYCPFDAIKMDHDYELSVYKRLFSIRKSGLT